MTKPTKPVGKEFTRQEALEILEQCRKIEKSNKELMIRAKRCLVDLKVVR